MAVAARRRKAGPPVPTSHGREVKDSNRAEWRLRIERSLIKSADALTLPAAELMPVWLEVRIKKRRCHDAFPLP